eukprot:4716585-Ditylum_brightwellii.AAC.2
MGIAKLLSKPDYFHNSGYWPYHPVMKGLGMTHNQFTFLRRHLHLRSADISAAEAKEEMIEQEARNSIIDNEKVLSIEPVVVHCDPINNEGALDDENDDLSTGSEDNALASGVLSKDVTEDQFHHEPKSQWFVLAYSKTSYIIDLMPDGQPKRCESELALRKLLGLRHRLII